MSDVTLTIAGRAYAVACAEGEEAHVAQLGRLIDSRIASTDGLSGQGEVRTLLFAALLLADELHEARKARDSAQAMQADMGRWLEGLATALENLAERLESGPQNT